jgi:hypothetical protein
MDLNGLNLLKLFKIHGAIGEPNTWSKIEQNYYAKNMGSKMINNKVALNNLN